MLWSLLVFRSSSLPAIVVWGWLWQDSCRTPRTGSKYGAYSKGASTGVKRKHCSKGLGLRVSYTNVFLDIQFKCFWHAASVHVAVTGTWWNKKWRIVNGCSCRKWAELSLEEMMPYERVFQYQGCKLLSLLNSMGYQTINIHIYIYKNIAQTAKWSSAPVTQTKNTLHHNAWTFRLSLFLSRLPNLRYPLE